MTRLSNCYEMFAEMRTERFKIRRRGLQEWVIQVRDKLTLYLNSQLQASIDSSSFAGFDSERWSCMLRRPLISNYRETRVNWRSWWLRCFIRKRFFLIWDKTCLNVMIITDQQNFKILFFLSPSFTVFFDCWLDNWSGSDFMQKSKSNDLNNFIIQAKRFASSSRASFVVKHLI